MPYYSQLTDLQRVALEQPDVLPARLQPAVALPAAASTDPVAARLRSAAVELSAPSVARSFRAPSASRPESESGRLSAISAAVGAVAAIAAVEPTATPAPSPVLSLHERRTTREAIQQSFRDDIHTLERESIRKCVHILYTMTLVHCTVLSICTCMSAVSYRCRSGELLFHAEKILENTIANVLREAQRHEFNITARPRLIALPRRGAAGAAASDGLQQQQQQQTQQRPAGGESVRVPAAAVSDSFGLSDGALEPGAKPHVLKFAQPSLTAST